RMLGSLRGAAARARAQGKAMVSSSSERNISRIARRKPPPRPARGQSPIPLASPGGPGEGVAGRYRVARSFLLIARHLLMPRTRQYSLPRRQRRGSGGIKTGRAPTLALPRSTGGGKRGWALQEKAPTLTLPRSTGGGEKR